MSKQRYVIIRGQVFRWEEKEPFTKTGHSIWGAVEYDREAELVKCHACGEWQKSLGQHARSYGISSKQYKLQYGLKLSAGICVPSLKTECGKRLSRHDGRIQLERARAVGYKRCGPSPEIHNEKGTCPAQTVLEIQRIAAEIDRTPTAGEVPAKLRRACQRRFGTWNKAILAAGLDLNQSRDPRGDLLEMLRDFYVLNKRIPLDTEFGGGRLPSAHLFVQRFGSLDAAYADAGLALVARDRQAA